MKKVFLICPVRGTSEHYQKAVASQVKSLEEQYEVYWPMRDTDQYGGLLEICAQNLGAMRGADEVFVIYDGHSEECLFDLGMAFALRKPVHAVIGYTPAATVHKSFANLIYEYEEEARP